MLPDSKKFFFQTIFILSISFSQLGAKLSSSMLDSIILVNLSDLKSSYAKEDLRQRRAAIEIEGELASNPAPELPSTLTSGFEASHEPPVKTSESLTQALSDGFAVGGAPSFDDLAKSIENISNKKDDLNLSNKSFLSALKSMISAYLRSGGQVDDFSDLPITLYNHILPKIELWGGGGVSNWVKNVSKVTVESFLDEDRSMNELSSLASGFALSTVELISYPDPLTDRLEINNLNLDYLTSGDDLNLNEKLLTGKNYSPTKTNIIQQLSVGISQGYFGSIDFGDEETGLSAIDFVTFSQPNVSPNSSNGGNITANIVTGFINGLLDSAIELGESKEVFIYDSIKAAANGFLIASTVAATSKPEYLDQALYLDSAEMISKQVSQSALLHSIDDIEGTSTYSMGVDWLEVDRVAESAASGSAMGSQLATVLPKSLDYSNSWEIATNIRRDIAKSVSRGSASGSVNAAAWLGSVTSQNDKSQTVLSGNDVERVARGASLGSMIGNTGLAIYYPTDQLVPIINLTAQGSAYGSTSSKNLSAVKSDSIETIDVGVARQSALGSSMGAIFEPNCSDGFKPFNKF